MRWNATERPLPVRFGEPDVTAWLWLVTLLLLALAAACTGWSVRTRRPPLLYDAIPAPVGNDPWGESDGVRPSAVRWC